MLFTDNKDMDLNKLKKLVLPVISKHLNLEKTKVFIFGSQANGNGHSRSDLDIGLKADQEIPAAKIIALREELESLPYLIDVVDFSQVDDDFKEIAQQNLIIWHQPSFG